MRMFIEVVLEPSALDEVWSVGHGLQADPNVPGHSVRWVKREAIHLTLRFLGEVREEQLPDIGRSLDALAGSGAFEISMTAVGSFGGRRPRVVWIGVARDRGYDRLQQLRRRLDQAMAEAGFSTEPEAFRPHLTLGRVRRQATRPDLAAIRTAVETAPAPDIRSVVKRVALVHSILLKDGPQYRRLALAEL